MKKEMTALVRTETGNLAIKRDDWFSNQTEFAAELRANGFRVLKIWSNNISNDEAFEWEFLNRKKGAFKKSMMI